MGLRSFLDELRESGRVRVAPPDASSDDDPRTVTTVLHELDRDVRSGLAFEVPPFRAAPAVWAASKLYRACQLFVFREPDDAMCRALSSPCPEPRSASVDYSVDLTFCFLPDLVTLIRPAAGTDALLSELLRLARSWPLSSVGISGVGAVEIDSFIDDPSLRQLYVDRVIARRDLARAAHPLVRDSVRQAIGLFPDLAPVVAEAIKVPELES